MCFAPERPNTLLGVWAHPDDESYLSAALMTRIIAEGGNVVVVTATRGEHGGTTSDPGDLAIVREGELRTAMSALGVDDIRLLGHPDGGCSSVDAEAATQSIIDIIDDVRPDLMVTFGSDGLTGHSDHIAVGGWTTAAASAVGHDSLLYATMTDEFAERHDSLHSSIEMWMDDARPLTVRDSDLALHVVPTAPERGLKQRALRAHRSQIGPVIDLIGGEAFDAWWVDEYFRRPTAAEWAAGAEFRVPAGLVR